MEIKLTENQLNLIKDRLIENLKEEKELRIKDRKNEPVNGWDFVALSCERDDLEYAIKNGFINT
jgi:hypothetical protein